MPRNSCSLTTAAKKTAERRCIKLAAAAYLRSFEDECPAVLNDKSPEALHRMRVASRRLRVALGMLSNLETNTSLKRYAKYLRAAGQALGVVREKDVQAAFLCASVRGTAGKEARAGMAALALLLRNQRAAARERAIHTLKDLKHRDITNKLRKRLSSLTPADRVTGKRQDAGALLGEFVTGMLARMPDPIDPNDSEGLHRLRIAVKKLRYSLEILAPCYGKTLAAATRAALGMHDVLGDLHEMDVWLEFLSGKRVTEVGDIAAAASLLNARCAALRGEAFRKFLRLWNSQKKRNLWKDLLRTVCAKPRC